MLENHNMINENFYSIHLYHLIYSSNYLKYFPSEIVATLFRTLCAQIKCKIHNNYNEMTDKYFNYL